jgi:transcriptional regulator with PAS, ATPase and Fis domain
MNSTKNKNIVFMSPFNEFSQLVASVCSEMEENVSFIEGYCEDPLEVAERLQGEGYRAIIAKRFTTSRIEGRVLIPVVSLEITPFDILRTMFEAGLNNKKIAYIGSWAEAMHYDFSFFEKILNVKIVSLPYDSGNQVLGLVKRAVKKNVDMALVTGICALKMCKNLGLPALILFPSRDSIIQGIKRAREIIAARKRDIEYSQQLGTVINAAYDGVVVGRDDKVIMVNPQAEHMLNVSAGEIMGKSIESFLSGLNINSTGSNDCNGDEVVKIGSCYLVVRMIPIKLVNGGSGKIVTFKDVSEVQKLEQQIRKEIWEKGLQAKFTFSDIIGRSKKMQDLLSQAKCYAQSDSTILVIGESGTGKELVAQSIHNASPRRKGPFVAVNCAAFPETLLDSELFGYDRGAFTGAEKKGKPGLFELAHRGTIFLDEISDLPFSLQAKLLRVLQEKEVRRISGDRIIPVDVRVLAATNKELFKEVKKGNFREDLYYRLNVLTLRLPPLRERKGDIVELANFFIEKYTKKTNKQVPALSDHKTAAQLGLYHWPGNVRELENFAERYVLSYIDQAGSENLIKQLLSENFSSDVITSAELIEEIPEMLHVRLGSMEEIELQVLLQLVQKYKMDKNKVADLLKISRTTLWKKLKQTPVQRFS